jgi:hypothetical protein
MATDVVKQQLAVSEAAFMCGESVTGFLQLVDAGYYPEPVKGRPRHRRKWNRKVLECRLDEIAGIRPHNGDFDLDEEFDLVG